MDYHIKLEQFEGPLDLLLSLIEEEKLDISSISLAKVTDQYISYLQQCQSIDPQQLADFLVVAAKLILIKSMVLVPSLDLEEEGVDLENQLKIYQEYLEASKNIHKMILKKNFSFPHETPLVVEGFYPPKKINKNILKEAFSLILKEIEPIIKLPQETIKKIISFQERIREVKKSILAKGSLKFRHLINEQFSRVEIILTFLAILELTKQNLVIVEQKNLFEEIEIYSCSTKK